MSKFCHKCGSKLKDADVFCEICGERQAASTVKANSVTEPESGLQQPFIVEEPIMVATPQQEIEQQPEIPAQQPASSNSAKKNPLFLWLGIGGAALVTVLLIVLLVTSLVGEPYKSTIDDYFNVYFYGAYEKMEDLAPEEYWDYLEESYGTTVDDAIAYYEDYSVYDMLLSELEAEYGDDLRFSYKIVHEAELSERKLNVIKDGLKDNYDIPKRTVKKAYELELEVTVSGSEDEDMEETELIVVNIDNDWYVTSASGAISFYWGS